MKDFTARDAAALLPKRAEDAHKGTFGFVLCAAGSLGMGGAGALTSLACLKAGCGRVTWAYPGKTLVRPAWEVMTLPLGGEAFAEADVDGIRPFLPRIQALCLGPGLGRREETFAFVSRLLDENPAPFVLDADGLMAFAGTPDKIPHGERGILTPHEGETAALLGRPIPWVHAHREEAVQELAARSGAVAVLKGHETLVCDGEEVWRNRTGNAGMATAGAGDVLTGLIGGLLAQGLSPLDAARVGVCLHGAAGDLAARQGSRGLVASDILEAARTVLAQWDGEIPG